jgi:PEP-CTERM motif
MNGIARTPTRTEASYHLWLGLTLLGAGALLAPRVEASAIVHSAKIDRAELGRSWSEYLLGGPTVWDRVPHPPVTDAVKREIGRALKTDPGGTAPMVQFLLNKQSLDPKRFDHYHPRLAPLLARFKTPTTSTTTTTTIPTTGAQVVTTPSTTTPTITTPTIEAQTTGGPPSQTVPEPGALLLAIGMAGWAAWWRRRMS